MKNRNIIVLPGFHESDEAAFASNLKAHRVVNRGVVGNQDDRATIWNSIGVGDAKSFKHRKINCTALSEQLDRHRKTWWRTPEIHRADRDQAEGDNVHSKLGHSKSCAGTTPITRPDPGPQGIGPYSIDEKPHDRSGPPLTESTVRKLPDRFRRIIGRMPAISVANVTPRGVVDYCRSRGVSSEGLLAAARVPSALISVPGSRLSAEQAFALWEEAGKATSDPMIAEHVIAVLPFGTYRIADYLLLTGATPRDSLKKFIRSFPLVNGAFELQLSTAQGGTHLELHNPYAPEGPSHFYVEFIFSMIFARLRLAAGVEWRPKEICFAHAAPAGMDSYHPTYCCPVRFNESINRMTLEREIADMTLPSGNALLSDILDHYGQALLKQSSNDDFLGDVRKVIADGFTRGDVRLQATARKLALSGRSLQRELNSRGTSYRDELDAFRRDLALNLLSRAGIHQILNLLQFSELSSFHRAFRRWTGKTPQGYLRDRSS